MAASVFSELKWENVNCEYASEYAKDKVWEKSINTLNNQVYVFGKQHHRIWKLKGQTEVAISDSPLLLSIIYDKSKDTYLHNLVVSEFSKCRNLNYYLVRKSLYNPSGRLQTERESIEKDDEIKCLIDGLQIQYKIIPGVKESVQQIVKDVLAELRNEWISVDDRMPPMDTIVETKGGDCKETIVRDYFSSTIGDWMYNSGDPQYWRREKESQDE